jgi:hypothetical protein
MADPELVRVMDYILNRCDEGAIEAVAAAVVRRRRDLALFGGAAKLPDPRKLALNLSSQINAASSMEGLKDSVRKMALRIIRQEAPELSDAQAEDLTRAWVPAAGKTGRGSEGTGSGPVKGAAGGHTGGKLPRDLLESMISQFITYSLGRMSRVEDQNLRAEMGAWPERYWKAFPQVIRSIISDFLKGEMTEGDFNAKIRTACAL